MALQGKLPRYNRKESNDVIVLNIYDERRPVTRYFEFRNKSDKCHEREPLTFNICFIADLLPTPTRRPSF